MVTFDSFYMRFVDSNADGARWSADWCLQTKFFGISQRYYKDGKVMVCVLGLNDTKLLEIEVPEDAPEGFSGWVDVVIGIELDPKTDSAILRYFVNGVYCATLSHPLTTTTNGINSVYISGYTDKPGSGIYIDDIVFGYTTNAEWIYEIKGE